MTEDHLKQALSELQDALESRSGEDKTKALADVDALVKNIEQQLAYPDTDAEIDTLLDEIKGQAASLEVTHPKVASVLRQVLNIMNNMGL